MPINWAMKGIEDQLLERLNSESRLRIHKLDLNGAPAGLRMELTFEVRIRRDGNDETKIFEMDRRLSGNDPRLDVLRQVEEELARENLSLDQLMVWETELLLEGVDS